MGHYGDSEDVGDLAMSVGYPVPSKQRQHATAYGANYSTFGDLMELFNEITGPVAVGDVNWKNLDNIDWAGLENIVKPSRRRGSQGESLRERLKREHRELSDAIGVLAGKLARREQQLAHLARYSDEDPCVDGAILRFEKKFPGSEQRYTYVAIRVDDLWYLTGERSPQGITWEKLVDFMGLGVDEVWYVNAVKRTQGGKTQQVERKIIG